MSWTLQVNDANTFVHQHSNDSAVAFGRGSGGSRGGAGVGIGREGSAFARPNPRPGSAGHHATQTASKEPPASPDPKDPQQLLADDLKVSNVNFARISVLLSFVHHYVYMSAANKTA